MSCGADAAIEFLLSHGAIVKGTFVHWAANLLIRPQAKKRNNGIRPVLRLQLESIFLLIIGTKTFRIKSLNQGTQPPRFAIHDLRFDVWYR